MRRIRARIIEGFYTPGERLVEDRVAEDLGVSRNPVREALRVLEAEGFITMAPRRGASVTNISDGDAEHVLEVIKVLDAFAARLTARYASEADVAKLRRTLTSAGRALENGQVSRFRELNIKLHDQMLEISGNPYLTEITRSLRARALMFSGRTSLERGPQSMADHETLLQAIADGDEAGAEAVAAQHVSALLMSVLAKRSSEVPATSDG